MFKVTKNGIEELGETRELSDEDREFIHDMFNEYSNAEKTGFEDHVFDE